MTNLSETRKVQPARHIPLPACRRRGGYEIVGHLGTGGQARVYAARGPRGAVAIKDVASAARMQEEAALMNMAAARGCPGLVGLVDYGIESTDDGQIPYIVMEYVAGRTIRQLMAERGVFNV